MTGQKSKNHAKWSEAESRVFLKHADIFVPQRHRQIKVMSSLIPANIQDRFSIAEIGAGDGRLASSVLNIFPGCYYIALEKSNSMRNHLENTLRGPFSNRLDIRNFKLENKGWIKKLPIQLRCILSSLTIHHLSKEGKRKLFKSIASHLEPGGAFIIADLVEPSNEKEKKLFARQWDSAVRTQSMKKTGRLAAFRLFQKGGWNYYAEEENDSYDQPSLLSDQLKWLEMAGFARTKCFWMHAGHAIFGGYR